MMSCRIPLLRKMRLNQDILLGIMLMDLSFRRGSCWKVNLDAEKDMRPHFEVSIYIRPKRKKIASFRASTLPAAQAICPSL